VEPTWRGEHNASDDARRQGPRPDDAAADWNRFAITRGTAMTAVAGNRSEPKPRCYLPHGALPPVPDRAETSLPPLDLRLPLRAAPTGW